VVVLHDKGGRDGDGPTTVIQGEASEGNDKLERKIEKEDKREDEREKNQEILSWDFHDYLQ
jgi:hypothetical protein